MFLTNNRQFEIQFEVIINQWGGGSRPKPSTWVRSDFNGKQNIYLIFSKL